MSAPQSRTARRLSLLCLALAVLCGLAAAASGFGHRLGLWDFRFGFTILRWAAYVGLGAAAMAIVAGLYALARRSFVGFALAGLGIAVGVATAALPWNFLQRARSVPPIHDITTDTENPPRFVDLLPLRAGAPNPAEYGGQSVAAQQQKAYPQLGPVKYRLPPDQVFRRSLEIARELGWTVVAAVPEEGRIEATDETFWFGFVDDVVIRIRSDEGGSRVDIRSKSRQGVSDVGTNAARVRAFIERLIEGSAVQ